MNDEAGARGLTAGLSGNCGAYPRVRMTRQVNVRDKLNGVKLSFTLAGQHAALALIGRQERRIIARYGF